MNKDLLVRVEYSYGYTADTFDFHRTWAIVNHKTRKVRPFDVWQYLLIPTWGKGVIYASGYVILCIVLHNLFFGPLANELIVWIILMSMFLTSIQFIRTRAIYDVRQTIIFLGHGYGEPVKKYSDFLNGQTKLDDIL